MMTYGSNYLSSPLFNVILNGMWHVLHAVYCLYSKYFKTTMIVSKGMTKHSVKPNLGAKNSFPPDIWGSIVKAKAVHIQTSLNASQMCISRIYKHIK